MTNCQSTLNNILAETQDVLNMLYGSDDEDEAMFEDFIDDKEIESITAPHYRSTNAYYTHQDRIDSHIYKTYLSPEATKKGVQDKSSYLGKKFARNSGHHTKSFYRLLWTSGLMVTRKRS